MRGIFLSTFDLPVLFAIDRAGLVGADGATHAGNYDLAYLRCIPNLSILAPSNAQELSDMLDIAYTQNSPSAVRYPRGNAIIVNNHQQISWGKASIIYKANFEENSKVKIAILAFGSMVNPCLNVSKKINATVVNMRFIKPIDKELIKEICNNYTHIITVEEGCIMGGAGSACLEEISKLKLINSPATLLLGLPDMYIDHGDPAKLLSIHGLDEYGIEKSINNFIL